MKLKNRGKALFLMLILIGIFALLAVPQVSASASGLVDVVIDSAHLYSRYELDNYQLDFYVDTAWSWLPWSWLDGIERSILYGVYCITDALWGFSKTISSFTGEVIGESYNLNLVGELSERLGKSMQSMAGISKAGLSDGFLMGFLPWILLMVGVYVAYVGLVRREMSKAVSAVVNMIVIFAVTVGLIAYAPDYVASVNDFSADISKAALKVGTGFLMPGQTAPTEIDDSVELVRDNLFTIQVYQPWLILQYGTSDIHAIGDARVENLLSKNPQSEYGSTREAVVIEEIETYGNLNMTVTNVGKRFGMTLLVILVNLIISVVVIMLCGSMLLSQIMFLLFAMVLPVSLVLAMFPTMGGLAKSSVLKVFNVILFRAGITLLTTIAFCISSMIYSIADSHSFLMIGYLQIVVFVGIYLKKNEILTMFTLQNTGEGDIQRSIMRNFLVTAVVREKMYDLRADRRQRKREKRRERKQDRQEASDNRTLTRMERRESRQLDSDGQGAFSADGGGGRVYQAADSAPRMANAEFRVKEHGHENKREPDSRKEEDRGERLTEMDRRTPESQAGHSVKREKQIGGRVMENASSGQANARTGDQKKSAGTTGKPWSVRQNTGQREPQKEGLVSARHSARKKLRAQSGDRRRALLEKRKNAGLRSDRIPYQGEQYYSIWSDALNRGNASGPSVTPAEVAHSSGEAAHSPVKSADVVYPSGQPEKSSSAPGGRNSGKAPGKKNRQEKDGHLSEISRETSGGQAKGSAEAQRRDKNASIQDKKELQRPQPGQEGRADRADSREKYQAKGLESGAVKRGSDEEWENLFQTAVTFDAPDMYDGAAEPLETPATTERRSE